jgi:hypothetical protein
MIELLLKLGLNLENYIRQHLASQLCGRSLGRLRAPLQRLQLMLDLCIGHAEGGLLCHGGLQTRLSPSGSALSLQPDIISFSNSTAEVGQARRTVAA